MTSPASTSTAALYATLAGPIRSRLARTLPADKVDDALQEVFVRVQTRIDDVRDPSRLPAWVWSIARNVATDTHRQRTHEAFEDVHSDQPIAHDDPTETVASWLPTFVDALPEPYAQAVRLVDLEGLSQQDLATRLQISPSGARSRVQRGRALLKARLLECCHVALEGGDVVDVRPNRCGC
jgi:RNA polymerase sigma-70 factor, ECF subfamily